MPTPPTSARPTLAGVIRPYRDEDRAAVYDICLLTGDAGEDATGLYESDELLADVYAGPYVSLEPEHAFVLEAGGAVLGYVIAAADSIGFVERYRRSWLPRFAARYPLPEAILTPTDALIAAGHAPEDAMIGPDIADFPAHLHIDLLPAAQGHGWGRALMSRLVEVLRAEGVPGVQLGVGERNVRAQAFYRRLGFAPMPSSPHDPLRLGIRTDAPLDRPSARRPERLA